MSASNVGAHYTDMKGKPCPLVWPRKRDGDLGDCHYGYCPDCGWFQSVQKERARELAKEIDNLGEK